MLLRIANVFSREETDRIRSALEQANWQDGRVTAGYQSAKAKYNLQLEEDEEELLITISCYVYPDASDKDTLLSILEALQECAEKVKQLVSEGT